MSVVAHCHFCGNPIFQGERHKVDSKNHYFHFDHGVDCLARLKQAHEVMLQMELEYEEVDHVAGRGYE